MLPIRHAIFLPKRSGTSERIPNGRDFGCQIEPWLKKLQEQFWKEGKHREESGPYVRTEGSLNFKASGPEATVFHLAEFFDSVRSRRAPVEDAEMGHRSAAAGHMVNLSVRSGKKVVWDAGSGTAKEA
jgi:hypothetical protein